MSKLVMVNDSDNFNKYLGFNDCPYNGRFLKPDSEVTEDVDYKLLNDQCFEYLHNIYGGHDIRRWSVALMPVDSDVLETSEATSASGSISGRGAG